MDYLKVIIYVSFLVTCILQISYSKPDKFFRKNYKYLQATESFYKIHKVRRSWDDAKKRCDLEGATLFYPNDEDEAQAVLSYWNETNPSLNWFFIGISTPNVKGVYETVDGRAIDDVYSNWAATAPDNSGGLEGGCLFMRPSGTIDDDECKKRFPFICKKTKASLRWNEICDLPDPGEGLKSVGYSKWSDGQPDGQGNETCGSMFYNGLLNDISCDVKCFFICEHEIPLLQTAIDYKFGVDEREVMRIRGDLKSRLLTI